MNKIYKVIWNKTKGCYVVVSEIAKSHSKTKSMSKGKIATSAFLAASVLVGLGAVSSTVEAMKYIVASYQNISTSDGRLNNNSVLLNPNADARMEAVNEAIWNPPYLDGSMQGNYTLLGFGAKSNGRQSTFVGYRVQADQTEAPGKMKRSVGLGESVIASSNPFKIVDNGDSGQAVGIGSDVMTTAQATAIGNNVYAIGRSSIVIGSDDNAKYMEKISEYDYQNYFRKLYDNIDKEGQTYGFKGGQVVRQDSTAYSPTLAQGDGSIAIGARSLAYAEGATSLGTLAFALKKGSTAVGTLTRSEGEGSIALGNKTSVFADNSVGTGNEIQILNQGGMAYGYKGYAGGKNSMAIGSNVYANTLMDYKGTITTTDGKSQEHKFNLFNPQPDGHGGVLYFDLNGAAKIAGKDEPLMSGNYFSTIMRPGTTNRMTYLEALENAIVNGQAFIPITADKNGVKDVVQKSGDNAIVIGSYSAAIGDNSIALGHGSFALNKNTFAIGSYAFANATNGMAIGLTSRALGDNSLALGVGTSTSDKADDSIAIGTGSVNNGAASSLLGNNSRIWTASNALLFGANSEVSGKGNIGIGNSVSILANHPETDKGQNIALGNNVKITPGTANSIVIGTEAYIGNKQDRNALSKINNALAIGFNAVVTNNGTDAALQGDNSMAIGTNATATLNNSIALGVDSKTDYTPSDLQAQPWVMPGAIAIPTSAKTGVVSVGAINAERRIVNVASGYKDTDAVNVGQLKMITEQINLDIDQLRSGGGTSYQSIQTGKGQAAETAAKINKQVNYEVYTNLKSKYLAYEARQKLNGEEFNKQALDAIKDKLLALEKGDPDIKTTAEALNKIVIPTDKQSDHAEYEKIMAQIDAAYNTDKGKSISDMTPEEIKKLKDKTNYNNEGAQGADSLAFGYAAHTGKDASDSVALGTGATVNGASSVGIGKNAIVEDRAINSVAIGNDATVKEGVAQGLAIGNGAIAKTGYSVALGSSSITEDSEGNGVNFGGKYDQFKGTVQNPYEKSVVSIGAPAGAARLKDGKTVDEKSPEFTRRLVHLAAGVNDTDAVNVAQLRTLANNKIVLGGDADSKTEGITLGDEKSSDENRLKFNIVGAPGSNGANQDITTTATGNNVTIKLNKGDVTSTETKAVSGQKVYLAIKGAKTKVDKNSDILTIEKTEKEDITGNSYTLGIDNNALKNALSDTFAKADASNISAETWRSALDVYSKTETDANIAKAKTQVKPAKDSMVSVNETSQNPSVYELDLSADVKNKITNLPADTNAELAKKLDNTTYESDKAKLTNNLDGKAGTDMGNLTQAGKNAVKDLAGEAIDIQVSNKLTVKADTKDNKKTFSLDVNEDNFDAEKIKSKIGGVTNVIPPTDNNDNAVTTAGAVKNYVEGKVTTLTNKGLSFTGDDGSAKANLGSSVTVNGNNGVKVKAEGTEGTNAKLTISLDDATKGKIDNALAKDGSNIDQSVKNQLQENLGLGDFAKKDASNVKDKAQAWRTAIEVMSTSETNTAIDNAKSKVAVKDGLSMESSQPGSVGPTTYTIGLGKELADKLSKLPEDTNSALDKKANKTDLTGKANVALDNINDDGKKVLQKAATDAVTVNKAPKEKAISVDKVVAGNGNVEYQVKLDATQLDAEAIKAKVGGVATAIPETVTNDDTNKVTTVGAVTGALDALGKKGFNVTSNGGTTTNVSLGNTFTVKGDGTYLTGTTTGSNGTATVELSLAAGTKAKIDNLPDNTNEVLAGKANTDLDNLSDKAKTEIKTLAGKGVKVAVKDNKLSKSEITDPKTGTLTYQIGVNEENFDAEKIKAKVGGVATTVPTTVPADANEQNKLTTVGGVSTALSNLINDGIKVAGNSGEATTKLGKKVAVKGDGTYLTSTAAADSDSGSTVTVNLSEKSKKVIDNAVLLDGTNIDEKSKQALQTALGVNDLGNLYAKVDGSNISSNAAKWRTALNVNSKEETKAAINNARTKLEAAVSGGVEITPANNALPEDGAITYTVGLSKDVKEKLAGVATSTTVAGKADNTLGNITEEGKTVVKNLAQEAVKVDKGDDTIIVDANTADGVTTYKVKVDAKKLNADDIKELIGGVTTSIPEDFNGTNAAKENKVTTAGAVSGYVATEISKVKSTGFNVTSDNSTQAVTTRLGKNLAIKGDNKTITGKAVSDGDWGTVVTLGLSDAYKTKIDNAVATADYKVANDIDAAKWKEALGVSNIDLSYTANSQNPQKVTLAKGLNFVNGKNTTATVKKDGEVTFDINKILKGVNSIQADGGATITLDGDTISLSTKPDAEGLNPNGLVKLTGLMGGNDTTDAVNYGQLKQLEDKIFGGNKPSKPGEIPDSEPQEKPDDHLNNTGNAGNLPKNINDRVNTLLNGTAGNMVYTGPNGERLDYDPNSKNFHVYGDKTRIIPMDKIVISAVAAIDGETTTPSIINNVGSALNLAGTYKDGDGGKPGRPVAITEEAAHKVINGTGNNDGLLQLAGPKLTRAANLGDLQALAQAGYDLVANSDENANVDNGANELHMPIGTKLTVVGGESNTFTAAKFDSDNLVTYIDTTDDQSKVLRVALKKTPKVEGLELQNGKDGKTVTITPDKDGNINLSNGNTPDNKVSLSGIKEGDSADSIATKGSVDEIKEALGLNGKDGQAGQPGQPGTTGQPGPSGQDGLNGATITNKIDAQRNGTSGNMVYTDDQGNRLVLHEGKYYPVTTGMVQGKDGEWYQSADQLDQNGNPIKGAKKVVFANPVSKDKISISAVNPDGSVKDTVKLTNVASGLGLDNTTAVNIDAPTAKNAVAGQNGLLTVADKGKLNTAATIRDLQAVAQAGIDFSANSDDKGEKATAAGKNLVHVPLGNALQIKGDGNAVYDSNVYDSSNLVTYTKDGAVNIAMKKAPNFNSVSLGSNPKTQINLTPSISTSEGKPELTLSSKQDGTGKVVLNGLADSKDADAAVTRGTFDKAMEQLGINTDGLNGSAGNNGAQGTIGGNGPAGKDGLNGTNQGQKIDALRNGTAGNMVYTTDEGDRLTRVGDDFYKVNDVAGKVLADGKWYNPEDVKDGKPLPGKQDLNIQALPQETPISISAVDPNTGETVNKPVALANIASSLGTTGTEKAADATKAVQVLLTKQGADLNKVATVGDLTVLAKAGYEVAGTIGENNGSPTIHRNLGEGFTIQGAAVQQGDFKADDYTADNLVTTVNKDNATVTIQIKRTPDFKGIQLNNGEAGAKTVSITPTKDGDIQLSNGATPNDKVVISGIKDGDSADSVATKGAIDSLKETLGLNGTDGAQGGAGGAGQTGPAGQDGLNSKSILEKIQAQRDGLSGNMVYTNEAGERLVNVDGKYYPAEVLNGLTKVGDKFYNNDDLENGKPKDGVNPVDVANQFSNREVNKDDVRVSAVNPDGSTTKPVSIGNVASGLGLENTKAQPVQPITGDKAREVVAGAAKDGKGGLLTQTTGLNNVATVGDLQAVAQAGLDFTSNEDGKTVHRPLGTALAIKGADGVTTVADTDYSAANVATTVDATNNAITIQFKKAPNFDSIVLGADPAKAVTITPDENGKSVTLAGPNNGKVEIKGVADGTAKDSIATKGQLDDLRSELGLAGKGNTGSTGATGGNGPAGKDGLDGKGILDKVQGLRDGMAGSMVYTTTEGDRVTRVGDDFYKTAEIAGKVKATDGKWYPADQLDDGGKPKADAQGGVEVNPLPTTEKLVISAVDGREGSTTAPTKLQNVASGLDLTGNTPINETDAKAATDKLLKATGKDLNNVVTVGDLQAVAQTGMDFKANSDADGKQAANNIHRTLGQAVTVQGKAGATYTATDYATDNLVTYADATSGTINIAMKKAPTFDKVTLATGENQGIDITPTKEADGNPTGINFGKANAGTGDSAVTITGVKEGKSADSVATKGSVDEVKEVLGLNGKDGAQGPAGIAGQNGNNGPAAKDGLNGSSIISQTQALRDGTAGNSVYTDKEGNRLTKVGDNFYPVKDLVQGKDGNWYAKDDLDASGKPKDGKSAHDFSKDTKVEPENIMISQVNPNGETTKPVTVGNVASGLGLNGAYEATDSTHGVANPAKITADKAKNAIAGADGNGGLLAKEGKDLNNVATVGDLQAVAQAGIDVAATSEVKENAGTNIHLPLGNQLTIQGNTTGKYDETNYSTTNLITAADPTTKTITIAMKSTPEFNGVKVGPGNNKVIVTADPNGESLVIGKPDTNGGIKQGEDGKVSISGVKEGTSPDSVATKGSVDEIKQALGLDGANGSQGGAGVAGQAGPAGKDGLDGKSMAAKIDALRNGEAGSMVYTTPEGDRLTRVGNDMFKAEDLKDKVKANNGQWYNADQVEKNGEPKAEAQAIEAPKAYKDKVVISTVNKDGSTTDPSVMNNVGSGLGLTGFANNTTAATDDSAKNPGAIEAGAAQKAIAGENGQGGLINAKGSDLTKAANLQDLQAVAQAGIDVSTNKNAGQTDETANVKHMPLGTGFGIIGDDQAQYSADKYAFDNMVTTMDNGNVRIGLAKAPRFESIQLGKDKENVITLTPDTTNNTLTITNPTTGKAGEKGTVIKGVASGDTPDSVVTNQQLNEVKDFLGIGKDGNNGKSSATSPAGKDGLDGQSVVDKVDALRQGIAGNMVYTTEAGTRIVKDGDAFYPADAFKGLKKAEDDKWYQADQVDGMGKLITKPGEAKPEPVDLSSKKLDSDAKVIISAVDANGETTTPINLGNVKSGLGLTGKADNSAVPNTDPVNQAPEAINAAAAKEVVAGQNGKSGLLSKSGADLTRVATVGDLQALAQAGFDFTANSDDEGKADKATMHKPLGTGVSILGGNAYSAADYTADNLATYAKDGAITITMKKSPQFDTVKIGEGANPIVISKGDEGSVHFGGGANGTDPVTITGVKSDPKNPNSVATAGDIEKVKEQLGINGKDGGQGAVGESGAAGKDGFGNSSIGNKVNAQRNGLTGNMVYTDKEGKRLVKVGENYYNYDDVIKGKDLRQANDGKWYPANKVNGDGTLADGAVAHDFATDKAVDKADIMISAVNPNGNTAKDGISIGNVKGNLAIGTGQTATTVVGGEDGKSGLLAQTENLDKAATVGDLKVLANAGMVFETNEMANQSKDGNKVINKLGSTIKVTGKADATYNEADYSTDNMVTYVDEENKAIRIAMKQKPSFKEVQLASSDGTKAISLTPKFEAGKNVINLAGPNTETDAEKPENTKVVITGVAAGTAPDSAVNLEQLNSLKNIVGGTAKFDTPVSDDALNNVSIAGQVNAQRAGTSGTMIYTDADGNRLAYIQAKNPALTGYYPVARLQALGYAQGKDGNWYKKENLDGEGNLREDVTPETFNESTHIKGIDAVKDVIISSVNPTKVQDGTSTTNPMSIGNVASGLGLNGMADNSEPTVEDEATTNSEVVAAKKAETLREAKRNPQAINAEAAKLAIAGNGESKYILDEKDEPKLDADTNQPIPNPKYKGGLLDTSGAALNRVATIGDLQAAAQAGLDFTSNQTGENTTIHRPLGTTLSIRGAAENFDKEKFSGENLFTTVDVVKNAINIHMAKTPVFDGVQFGNKGPTLTVQDGKLAVKDSQGNIEKVVTGDAAGFWVKANDKKYFVPMNGTLELEGDDNVSVNTVDKKAAPTTPAEKPAGTTAPATETGAAANAGDASLAVDPGTTNNAASSAGSATTPAAGAETPANNPATDTNAGAGTATPATNGEASATTGASSTPSATEPAPAGTQGEPATSDPKVKENDTKVGITMSKTPTFNTVTIKGEITDKTPDNAAVTKGYVDAQVGEALKGTGEAIQSLGSRVEEVSRQSNAGTASALAAANIPQMINGDRRQVFGMAMGSYRGQNAMAMGISGTNHNRDFIYKVTGTVDSTGSYGFSAGIGFTFGPKDSNRKDAPTVAPSDFNRRLDQLEAQQSEIQDLRAENKELKQEIEDLKRLVQEQLNLAKQGK